MRDAVKTKKQLISELDETYRHLAELEALEAKCKRAEEELRQQAQILEHVHDLVICTDLDGYILSWNKGAERVYGYSAEEALGKHISFMYKDEQRKNIFYQQVIRPLLEKGSYETEVEVLTKTGEGKCIHLCLAPIRDSNDNTVIMCGYGIDITERKRADDELKTILKTAFDGFWRTDLEGKFLEVNDSFCKMTGYTREELLKMSTQEIEAVDSPEEITQRIKKIAEQGSDWFETRHKRRDGNIIDVEVSVNYLDVGEGQFFVFARDITERKRAEAELGESEEKYRSLVQGFADGIAIVQGLEMRFVNDRLLKMFGYQRENEIVGHPFTEFISPSYRSLMAERGLNREAGKNMPNCYEFRALRKDGTEFDAEIYVTLIRFQGVTARQGIIRDITERKRAEEALKESEGRFRIASQITSDVVYERDLQTGIATFYGDIDSHLGYAPGGYPRTWEGWRGHVHPEDLAQIESKSIDQLEPGIPHSIEYRMRKKDGTYMTWLDSIMLILDEKTGKPLKFIGAATDITERKRAEEAIKESEERFSKAFRSSPEAIAITTIEDGKFIEVNDNFNRITGYTREEVIGHSATELDMWINPEERARVIQTLKEQSKVRNEEFNFRRKPGEAQTVLFSAETINIGGEPCIIAAITDITERKRAEEQAREAEALRKLDKLRTELLANISHELRTPLTSIKGFATMLLDYDRRLKRHAKRGYLETIDKNTDRLAELIDQLLMMSRLDAGTLTINKRPIVINKLCQEVIAEAWVRSPTHRFVLNLPKKLPKVNIDARRIQEVLDNLISNAVKYSEAGTEVTIAARQVGHELLVSVTDQGVGIPKKDLPRVFERMFRSRPRLIPGARGTGLGLSICKGLVEAHDGRIWIESEEKGGTRCYFTLPLYTKRGDNHAEKA
jgi:PAS domain S-box-containing protein